MDRETLERGNIAVFEDSMNYISENLQEEVKNSIANSKIYYDWNWPKFDEEKTLPKTYIQVTNDRSFTAAFRNKRLHPDKRIAVLNFANAFCPGGGVVNGCTAQEESLCRISTLYPVISSEEMSLFYIYNGSEDMCDRGTDALIYSKDITVFKSDSLIPKLLPVEGHRKVDVITMAAPDLFEYEASNVELYSIHLKRALHMFSCAAAEGADILILGAFGCGAFQNDPRIVARAWRDAIKLFPKMFKEIEFAIYGSDENYRAFVNWFGNTEVTYESGLC